MVDIQVLSKILTREAKKAPRVPPSLPQLIDVRDQCTHSVARSFLVARPPPSHLPPPISRSSKRASLRGTPLYTVTPPRSFCRAGGAHLGSNWRHSEAPGGCRGTRCEHFVPGLSAPARRVNAKEPCIFHAPNAQGYRKDFAGDRGFQGKEKRSTAETRHESPSHAR